MIDSKIAVRILLSIIVFAFLILTGCGSLLPSVKETRKTNLWGTFNEAQTAFEQIIPYKTTTDELQRIGFDPVTTPNLKILTHLDVIQRFMFNPSIKKEELDVGIQACIDAKTNCRAYEIRLQNILRKRYGNVLLDIFNFRRRTNETGWAFEALIVMVNSTVVYKVWGGTPVIDESREIKNPLGPLQDPTDMLKDTVVNGF